jgi:surface antigen
MIVSRSRKYLMAPLLIVAMLGVTGCDTTGGNKQTYGTLGGGVLGALGGAQFGKGKGQLAATAAGALLGALVGSSIGSSLDKADQQAMQQTTMRTLEYQPSGSVSNWSNPDTGNRGSVIAESAYQGNGGQTCRNYRQTVEVGGQSEILTGTACRQSDGTWRESSR